MDIRKGTHGQLSILTDPPNAFIDEQDSAISVEQIAGEGGVAFEVNADRQHVDITVPSFASVGERTIRVTVDGDQDAGQQRALTAEFTFNVVESAVEPNSISLAIAGPFTDN